MGDAIWAGLKSNYNFKVKPLQARPDLGSYLAAPGEGALVMVLATGEGDGDRWRLEGEAGRFPTGDMKRFSVSSFCFYKCKKNKRDHASSTLWTNEQNTKTD